jgi:fatty acyl-CoA reductase
MQNVVFLTGATGFLGKVVLEELLRCRGALGLDKVILLVRPTQSLSAAGRFLDEIATSPCFSRLEATWTSSVEVVSGDLAREACGLETKAEARLCKSVTHVIHCAASISFEADPAETLQQNVVGSLNILTLAQKCPKLQRFVSTSTAYATPHSDAPIEEALVPLPKPASLIFDQLISGEISPEYALDLTGHTNVYTLAKCLAEHLLVDRAEGVPLTIVRPSIISASWEYPFPGWVDSFAALTGIVAGIGTGILQVIDADVDITLDVVPVDEVSRYIIQELFASPRESAGPRIVHAVSTIGRGIHIGRACTLVAGDFRHNQVVRRPKIVYVGDGRSTRFQLLAALHHRLPTEVAKIIPLLRGDQKQMRRIRRVQTTQAALSTTLRAFTHSMYDFRAETFEICPEFSADEYLLRICLGVRNYLLHKAHSSASGRHESLTK